MNHAPDPLDQMLAAWNEPDPARVRAHLDRALAPNVRFVDPSVDLVGVDAFEANIHQVHEQLPGATYSRVSEVDSHHDHHRYHWAIHSGGDLILAGFDVTVTDDDGRVEQVIGFFGPLEPTAPEGAPAPVAPAPQGDRLLGSDLLSGDLGHQPLPVDEVVAGSPSAAVRPLAELGKVEVGLWEMSEGSARDTETDEVFVVLDGAGEVRFEDGEVLALAPGVAVRLRAGERTEWTVTEPLRKVYVAR